VAVVIERGTASGIVGSRWGFVVLVRGAERSRAVDALGRIAATLRVSGAHREGPAFVSSPTATPEGVFLHVDGGGLTTAGLRSLPQMLAEELEAQGVVDATISAPGRSELFVGLSSQPHSTVLMAYPRFARPQLLDDVAELPGQWAQQLVAWAGSGVDVVQACFGGAADPVLSLDAALDQAAAAVDAGFDLLLVGEPEPGVYNTARITTWHSAQLATLGPAVDELRSAAVAPALMGIGPRLTDVGYAGPFFDAESWAVSRGLYLPPDEEVLAPEVAQRCCDELVLDGLHWQLLTRGHIAHLGAVPGGAVAVGSDRWELTVGTHDQWWPADRRTDGLPGRLGAIRDERARQDARARLGCLIQAGQDVSYSVMRQEPVQRLRQSSGEPSAWRSEDQTAD
jgi:hypothetical protein